MSDIIDFGIYKGLEWKKLSSEYLHGLADMGNIQADEYLEKLYNSPIEIQTVGFGKFSGSLWVELDVDYLHWILNNVDVSNIKHILASRALEYIKNNTNNDDFVDVIYVD
ncbi:MAG: hypothetical protein CSA86_01055 [Arcobacter sp.]|nr:MAG: hypothetical protein CSA86_01055 [Arcobacter sp.]